MAAAVVMGSLKMASHCEKGKLLVMSTLPPALAGLVAKARSQQHLAHHERLALALSLLSCDSGEEKLHDILREYSDYSPEMSAQQIRSLRRYRPISCQSLQSAKYGICDGWCCTALSDASTMGLTPSPAWIGRCSDVQNLSTADDYDGSLLERVASVENLHVAWEQVRQQAVERDAFEDVIAYETFDGDLNANLQLLHGALLAGEWQHRSFRVLPVPRLHPIPRILAPWLERARGTPWWPAPC